MRIPRKEPANKPLFIKGTIVISYFLNNFVLQIKLVEIFDKNHEYFDLFRYCR
jgi:hypothetical protein